MGLSGELAGALVILNELREQKIIEDYAIGGGYAGIYYGVEYASLDVDIFAVVIGEDEWQILQPIYKHFSEKGHKAKREHIYIGDTPIQILPNVSLLHNDAVEKAKRVEIEGVLTRIIGIEHLIALSLVSYREKDKRRIIKLLPQADGGVIKELLDKFGDEENKLRTRYEKVLASS